MINDGLESFIERLEQYARRYGQPDSRQGGIDVEAELRKIATGSAAYVSGEEVFQAVQEGLDELVAVQVAIINKRRIDRSAIACGIERAFGIAVAKLKGADYEPETMDGLFGRELDVIAKLSATAASSLEQVYRRRDEFISYRDNRVLVELENSISGYASAMEDAGEAVPLFREADGVLARTKRGDHDFARLYKAHSAIKSRIAGINSRISMANQATVFRNKELPIVQSRIDEQDMYAHALEIVSSYVSAVAEHFEVVWKDYNRDNRSNSMQMEAMAISFEGLSEHVIMGAGEAKVVIAEALKVADKTANTSFLDTVRRSLGNNYRSARPAASHFDQKAAAVRSGYGLK